MREARSPILPRSEDEITATAQALNLPIPPACMPGVVANLTLLASHADILLSRNDTR